MRNLQKLPLPPSSPAVTRFLNWFDRLWGDLRPWILALWISRASVAILLLGAALFTFVGAVQDIILSLAQDVPHWSSPELQAHAFIPRIWFVLVDVAAMRWDRLGIFFLGLSIWAACTHYSARILLWIDFGLLPSDSFERENYRRAFMWIPRSLGALAIIAVIVGVTCAEDDNAVLIGLLAVELILFHLYAKYRIDFVRLVGGGASAAGTQMTGAAAGVLARTRRIARYLRTPTLSATATDRPVGDIEPTTPHGPQMDPRLASVVIWLLAWVRLRPPPPTGASEDVQPLFIPSAARNRGHAASFRKLSLADGRALWRLLCTFVIMIVIWLGILGWGMAAPLALAGWATQAGVLFFVLSSWLIFLSFLVFLDHWRRFPALLLVFALGAVLHWSAGSSNHELMPPTAAGHDQHRLTLDKALEAWNSANPERRGESKPEGRPMVIVATAGGGSAAAYWTATVLGALQDADADFRNRVFAVSAVSGGALGAATFSALLKRYDDRGMTDVAGLCQVGGDDAPAFKSCGQTITGGDFLSAPFAALGFRDSIYWFWPVGRLGDRATVIEQAWEQAWRDTTQSSSDAGRGANLFAEPFRTFGPDPHGAHPWRPVLFFNGTSIRTGKRIIAGQLAPATENRRIAVDAYDLFEMLPTSGYRDLSLSTAVTVSARFPYILPAGTVGGGPSCPYGPLCDGVVDGGYFENFGAGTAGDLWETILSRPGYRLDKPIACDCSDDGCKPADRANTRLQPVVIQISSDPDLRLDEPPLERWKASPMTEEIGAPPQALYNARSARGILAMRALERRACETGGQFVHFRLERGDYGVAIPLSWSLSRSAQQTIGDQLCSPYNKGELARLSHALGGVDLEARICPPMPVAVAQ